MRVGRSTLLTLVAGTLALSLPASAETVLKFSWFGPPVADFNKNGVFKWGDEVGKVTEGRVRIEFLAKSAGAPPAHFDLIRDGVVDAAYYLPGITRGRFVLHPGRGVSLRRLQRGGEFGGVLANLQEAFREGGRAQGCPSSDGAHPRGPG